MINFKTLTFGDTIYIAKEHNHYLKQKRIVMTDGEGVEWYRYDRSRFTYEIETITYCGKVTYIEEGEVLFDEDRSTQYHFKHSNVQIYPEHDNEYDFDTKEWFHTREEAEARIAELQSMRTNDG